jgi:hypothetical protein
MAEARIREAIERGEFDDLPGKGRPVELEDLSAVPEELRAGYLLLKRAGLLPEEMELRKELVTLERLLAACEDEAEREGLQKRWNERALRYRVLMERRRRTAAHWEYAGRIRRRLGL